MGPQKIYTHFKVRNIWLNNLLVYRQFNFEIVHKKLELSLCLTNCHMPRRHMGEVSGQLHAPAALLSEK
jgi:hypothetical protein